MWLKFLQFLGYTDLSDEQVALFLRRRGPGIFDLPSWYFIAIIIAQGLRSGISSARLIPVPLLVVVFVVLYFVALTLRDCRIVAISSRKIGHVKNIAIEGGEALETLRAVDRCGKKLKDVFDERTLREIRDGLIES